MKKKNYYERMIKPKKLLKQLPVIQSLSPRGRQNNRRFVMAMSGMFTKIK